VRDDCFDLKDSVVVVTGGLGQLGRQFSSELVARGAKVALFDKIAGGPQAADRVANIGPKDSVLCFPVDVTRRSSIEEAVEQVIATWGVPQGLINNAAIDSPPGAPVQENGPFETYPEESWDNVMEVNVKGVLLSCQAVGRRMAEAGRGSIINIGSIYGMVSPDQRIYEYRRERDEVFYKPVAYSVSKSALLNLTRYLATYWARSGVRVNSVTFGGVFNNQDQRFLDGYCQRVPLGRMAKEDEYNGTIIFLLSNASSYMTGANVVVDGGWTAW